MFEASLVYRVISRTARAIQRNPVSKHPLPPKIICMCVHARMRGVWVGVWACCECCAHRGQKRASDPLELELNSGLGVVWELSVLGAEDQNSLQEPRELFTTDPSLQPQCE